MRPRRIGSPSTGWPAGSGPARVRSSGRMLRAVGATCCTMSNDAGRSPGRPPQSCVKASTPPADAPSTITSRLLKMSSSRPERRPGPLVAARAYSARAVRPPPERASIRPSRELEPPGCVQEDAGRQRCLGMKPNAPGLEELGSASVLDPELSQQIEQTLAAAEDARAEAAAMAAERGALSEAL